MTLTATSRATAQNVAMRTTTSRRRQVTGQTLVVARSIYRGGTCAVSSQSAAAAAEDAVAAIDAGAGLVVSWCRQDDALDCSEDDPTTPLACARTETVCPTDAGRRLVVICEGGQHLLARRSPSSRRVGHVQERSASAVSLAT